MKDGQFTDVACYQLFGLGRAVGCSPPRLSALTGARSDKRVPRPTSMPGLLHVSNTYEGNDLVSPTARLRHGHGHAATKVPRPAGRFPGLDSPVVGGPDVRQF